MTNPTDEPRPLPPLTDDDWRTMCRNLDHAVSNWVAVGAPEDAVMDVKIESLVRLTGYVNALRIGWGQVDDLRWLVGHLAQYLTPVQRQHGLPMPPRLTPLMAACVQDYNPGRFTLANVVRAPLGLNEATAEWMERTGRVGVQAGHGTDLAADRGAAGDPDHPSDLSPPQDDGTTLRILMDRLQESLIEAREARNRLVVARAAEGG